MTDSVSDEMLAQQLSRGERQALVLLVERYHSRLIGYLYRLNGGNRALAEDWVQETFLRLLRLIQQYRYPQPFKAYVFAIAANLARDHFKSAESRYGLVPIERADHLPADDITPEQSITDADQVREVIAALGTLPVQQRETVILRYYEEWSLAEIAEALAIPIGTVKSRLSLGLKRLRELLGEEVRHEREHNV